jgi:hypothetical protein
MAASKPLYEIVSGKDGGSGSFLCPPGHPALTHSVHGYWNGRRKQSGPDLIAGIEFLIEDPYGDVPPGLKARAQKLFDDSDQKPSEEWVRHAYGYFAHSYSPDGVNRNVSDSISTSKAHCKCGFESWSRKGLNHHIDTERARARGPKGRRIRGDGGHYQISKPVPPPEHHLAYLLVKQYFPGYKPRLDLIAHPEGLYGTRECAKCHERVQYEARWDSWAKFGSGPMCPQGGHHEVPQPEGEAARIRIRANCHARDGEMHPTRCAYPGCSCEHYRWSLGQDRGCTCDHGSTEHEFRPNCDGTFDPGTEARLAAETGCCENCEGTE